MAKEKRILSYSVHVEPQRLGQYPSGSISDRLIEPNDERRLELYRERCQEIVEQLERHVDNVGSASVQAEAEDVCEHCGAGWTEATDIHNGGCCDADCDAMDAAKAKQK